MSEFNYKELVSQQEISVVVPDVDDLTLSEAEELLGLAVKITELYRSINEIRITALTELSNSIKNNYPFPNISTTPRIMKSAHKAYGNLDAPLSALRNAGNRDISQGYGVMIPKLSTPLNIIYTQLKQIMHHGIRKKEDYETRGSDCGHSGMFTLQELPPIIEKAVQMQNYIYDYLYLVSSVALPEYTELHGNDAMAIIKDKIMQFSPTEGIGNQTLQLMMKSFDPSTRFVVSEGEDIIFNLN